MPTNKQRKAAAKRKDDRQEGRRRAKAQRRRVFVISAGAVVAIVVIAAITFVVINDRNQHKNNTASTTTATTAVSPSSEAAATTTAAPETTAGIPPLPPFQPSASVGANCQYPPSPEKAAKAVKPPRSGKVPTSDKAVSISMATSQGNIGLMLANDESPCTVNSFVSLADQGFFDGTKCHRLTTSTGLHVLQCGDPRGDGTGGPGYQFANEYPTDQYPANDPKLKRAVSYPRGTLAMANAGPGTNGSQFFLVYRDSELPPSYTVFGKIQDDGLATLDKIAKTGVDGGGDDGAPATDVTIKSVLPD